MFIEVDIMHKYDESPIFRRPMIIYLLFLHYKIIF